MSNERSRSSGIVFGPVIAVAAILALWANEGRFDFARAARQTVEIPDLAVESVAPTHSHTGRLGDFSIDGTYVTGVTGYYAFQCEAEIYSWVSDEDEDGTSWSKEWTHSVESTSRNSGISQKLRSERQAPPSYRVGNLEVVSKGIHFSDRRETIRPDRLTLSGAARKLGLRPEGDYFYLRHGRSGDQLGDERLKIRGIPTQPTATYFGFVAGGRGLGKQMERKEGFIARLIGDDGMVHHLVNGSRDEALRTVKSDYRRTKWMVRLGGTGGVMVGILITLGNLLHLIIGLPLIGRLAAAGVLVFSIATGLFVSLVVIFSSVAYHHPWLVAAIVVAIGALVFELRRQRKTSRASAQRQLQAMSSPADGGPAVGELAGTTLGLRFRNLAKLAMADGKLDESEWNYLVQWGRGHGLADAEITRLYEEATREGDRQPTSTEPGDLYFLIALALSDGHLCTSELKQIQQVGAASGMNATEVNSMISQIRRGDMPPPMTA